MALAAGEVLLVDLGTGGAMLADHYALRERGLPDGYVPAEGIGTQAWLDAIAAARGRDPEPLPEAWSDRDVLVDLATGASRSQHKAMTRDHGIDAGWTDLDGLSPLDLLDAVRAACGLDPCDRAELGGEAGPAP